MLRKIIGQRVLQSPSRRRQLMTRMVKQRQAEMARVADELLAPNSFTAVLVGTGTPVPSERAQSSVAIFANGRFLLFDTGHGCLNSIQKHNLPIGKIDAVFLTHYHSDHIADLGEVINWSWIMGRHNTLSVYGPEGVSEIVAGFAAVYRLDNIYRNAHHGEEIMPLSGAGAESKQFDVASDGSMSVVYDEHNIIVKTFEVNHDPAKPAVGYRIDYQGKSVVISGDTVLLPSLEAACQGADLLICDAMNHEIIAEIEAIQREIGNNVMAHIMNDVRDYHIDVPEIGQLAASANVKHVALLHLMPTVNQPAQLEAFFVQPLAAHYSGKITVGEDGLKIEL
ncbi:MAG: MBL fold metallo-hydrolase [Chloroflexota bacterium]